MNIFVPRTAFQTICSLRNIWIFLSTSSSSSVYFVGKFSRVLWILSLQSYILIIFLPFIFCKKNFQISVSRTRKFLSLGFKLKWLTLGVEFFVQALRRMEKLFVKLRGSFIIWNYVSRGRSMTAWKIRLVKACQTLRLTLFTRVETRGILIELFSLCQRTR